MARRPPNTPSRIADIAHAIGGSPHSIGKVLQRLANAGVTISQRGVGGGFALARDAREISIKDVYTACSDHKLPLMPTTRTDDTDVQGLSRFVSDLEEQILTRFEATTIADLLDYPAKGSDAGGLSEGHDCTMSVTPRERHP